MRQAMKRHRRPDLAHISPRLDARIGSIAPSRNTKHAGLWASLKLPRRGRINIPLHPSTALAKRGGRLCPVVQLCTERDGSIGVRLVSGISEPCAALKASYDPQIDSIGIDFGLATLLATDRGDLMGRGLFADLRRLDKQIAGIARHRQRIGDKPRTSARYRRLVERVRGMLKTRINTALNRVIAIHRPATLSVERLEFRAPGLSRRLNRILSNCGRSVFRAKLQDLKERFGIVAEKVPAFWTSEECSSCHYVDRRNRRSQSRFVCRFCGCTKHADVTGACAVNARRSRTSGAGSVTPDAILAGLVRRFCERFRQPQGAAADPRFSNPHFAEWAGAARMLS
jgi:putative transposase